MNEKTNSNSNIFYQENSFDKLNIYLSSQSISKLFVLVDENTKEYCLPLFQKECEYPHSLIEIKSGETYKNLDTCQFIWEELANKGADRKSLLINLGGGVITDMGGFVASTYKRGIRFMNIPTTLLGMVDAAIGGKTGVDFNGLKNQIGLFSNAEMVLIIPKYLNTLPKRELLSGMAEVIKYGLIDDINIWNYIKNSNNNIDSLPSEIIKKSIEIKERIVKQDPTEQSIRKTLNFGHTLGHAIETYYFSKPLEKQLLHGEAIVIGMILAAHLSFQNKLLSLKIVDEIASTIKQYYKDYIPNRISKEDEKPIMDLLKHDKKNKKGETYFIFLTAIGKSEIDYQVSEFEILQAFSYYNLLF